MYRYGSRPGCSFEMPTCGSPYLFCDARVSPHCVSKVKLGGLCAGFEGLDACFNGICIGGRCVPGPTPAVKFLFIKAILKISIQNIVELIKLSELFLKPFIPQTQLRPVIRGEITRQHAARRFNDCFNRMPCCEQWAKEGDCHTNEFHMTKFCAAACGKCRPSYNTSNGFEPFDFSFIFS